MVEQLLLQHARGERDFARAWRRAQVVCRAAGWPRPRDFYKGPADEGWLPFSTFFRRQCEREWHGRVHVDYAGLREMLQDSSLSMNTDQQRAHERVTLIA